MTSSNSTWLNESSSYSVSNTPSSSTFENARLTEARISFSTSPTPASRKELVPSGPISTRIRLLGSSDTLSNFQYQTIASGCCNVTPVQRVSPESLDWNETEDQLTSCIQSSTGKHLEHLKEYSGLKDGIQLDPVNHLFLTPSPPQQNHGINEENDENNNFQVNGPENQPEQGRESETNLQKDKGKSYAELKGLMKRIYRDKLASSLKADPFLTFQAISDEFPLNSNIIDPYNDIRRFRLVTEIHQRALNGLGVQAMPAVDISSPLQTPLSAEIKERTDPLPQTPPPLGSQDPAFRNSLQSTPSSADLRHDICVSSWQGTSTLPRSGKSALEGSPSRSLLSSCVCHPTSGSPQLHTYSSPNSGDLARERPSRESPIQASVQKVAEKITVAEERLLLCKFCLEAGFDRTGNRDGNGSMLDWGMIDIVQDEFTWVAPLIQHAPSLDSATLDSTVNETAILAVPKKVDEASIENVQFLGHRMVDSCDMCRSCQTFNSEYEWIMEASRAHYGRYGGRAAHTLPTNCSR